MSTESNVYEYHCIINKILNDLKTLKLERLPKTWVNRVHDCNFDDFPELPPEAHDSFDATHVGNLLIEIILIHRKFLEALFEDQTKDDSKFTERSSLFWNSLLKKEIKVRALISLLAHLMRAGQKQDASFEVCDAGFKASCFYLLLVTTPGSGAFQIFHSILYTKSLSSFNVIQKMNIGKRSNKRNPAACSLHENDLENGGIDDDLPTQMSTQDSSRATLNMNYLLHNLLLLLQHYSLSGKEDCIEFTIGQLVKITRLEVNNINFSFGVPHMSTTSSLAYNAYIALYSFCEPLHGSPMSNARNCLKYLFSNIILHPREYQTLTAKAISIIREHTVKFIQYLTKTLKDQVYESISILVQHLCIKVPDKSDMRNKISQVVVEIMRDLSSPFYLNIIKFLLVLGHHESASHRYFSVEVISKLLWEKSSILDENFISDDPAFSEYHDVFVEYEDLPIKSVLLLFISSRLGDVAASVRAKSLSVLGESTDPQNPVSAPAVTDIMSRMKNYIHDNHNKSCDKADDIMNIIVERISDERVTVRRSALQVLYNLIRLESSFHQTSLIEAFSERSSDPAPLIRKYAITCITSLVITFKETNQDLLNCWCSHVLTRIVDVETKIQEKACEAIDMVIFKNIVPHSKTDTSLHKLPWRVLKLIDNKKLNMFLQLACQYLVKNGSLKSNIMSTLKTHIGTNYNDGVWFLMSILSTSLEVKKSDFVIDYLTDFILKPEQVGIHTLKNILKFLSNIIADMTEVNKSHIFELLMTELAQFNFVTDILKEVIDILHLISLEADNGTSQHFTSWSPRILMSCHDYLKSNILLEDTLLGSQQEEMIYRRLFVIGELAQLTPEVVDSNLLLFLQIILFNSNDPDDSLLSPSGFSGSPLSTSIRLQAVSILTLGKICLVQESLAKRMIPALGKLLDTSNESVIRCNVMLVLSDMCIRYGNLVTPLIPLMTSCLRDASKLVRGNSVVLVILLLQEDYLKLKGDFFYRLLSQLCDTDKEIQNIVKFYITYKLRGKNPKILFQHFVESLFYFNGYKGHEKYNKFQDLDGISYLSSADKKSSRIFLYKYMLENMNDEERFRISSELCKDILDGILHNKIPLSHSSYSLIEDTLDILSCEEIKLVSLKARSDDDTSEQDLAKVVMATAKTTIISNVVKKNVLENILPTLMKLKTKFKMENCPLYSSLLKCIKEVMKDHKNENVDMELEDEITLGVGSENDSNSENLPTSELNESVINDESSPATSENEMIRINSNKPKKITKVYQARKRSVVEEDAEFRFKEKPGKITTYSKRTRKGPSSSSDTGLCELDVEDIVFHDDDRCLIKIKEK